MHNLSTDQVKDLLLAYPETLPNSYSTGLHWWRWDAEGAVNVPDLGEVKVVDTEGGTEGGGEYAHVIVSVTRGFGTRYYKAEGYYSSYDGTEWDGPFTEVTPKQKTVTVYE